ncbi:MAG: FUSC family protein [Cellulosilyticaceae bacterium]
MKFKIGMRTLKTLIAVAICILSLALMGVDSPFFACIATIFVIQGDKDNSINNAKNRVWGTAFGALISNIVLFCLSFLPYNAYVQTIVTCLSIFLLIQVATYFNKPMAIFPGCIVLCAILCTTTNIQTPIIYGIKRTLHTLYGALIGLGVNLYFFPYNPQVDTPFTESVEADFDTSL